MPYDAMLPIAVVSRIGALGGSEIEASDIAVPQLRFRLTVEYYSKKKMMGR